MRVRDADTQVLVSVDFPIELEHAYAISVTAVGNQFTAKVGDTEISANDDSDCAFADGGVGLVVADGALSCNGVVTPVD